MAKIHERAVIDEGADLSEDVEVRAGAHVAAGARIGPRALIAECAHVGRGVIVRDAARVGASASVHEGVELAEGAHVGPGAVIAGVPHARAFADRSRSMKKTRIGRGAVIGPNAVVATGAEVGDHALVEAGAVVYGDVPAFARMRGAPATRVGWVSRTGAPLDDHGDLLCPDTGERFVMVGERLAPATSEMDTREAHGRPVPLLDLASHHGPLLPLIREAIERVVTSNQFILGDEVSAFEREVAQLLGVGHAIGVSSGTDALLLALMDLGIGSGDEVITTPFSFFATAGCIARLGARPVFVDIDPHTMNLDVSAVAARITERTKAILPVHLFGQPCDMDSLAELGEAFAVPIVEDAAQAILARTERGPVGALGAYGCFSFFPSKNLGAFGDAGLLTCSDPERAERARRLRAHGMHPRYFHSVIGGNFRIDALQAAILRAKLPHLPRWTEARRKNADLYDRLLAEAELGDRLTTPFRAEPGHVFNQYVIRTPHRDALRARLTELRIGTEIYYPRPLHLQECFAYLGHSDGDLPEAERASREALALPIYPELGESRVTRVAEAIISFLRSV